MSPGKVSDKTLLEAMLENAQYVQETIKQVGREGFFNDRTVRQAVLYSLQTLGQAANGISDQAKRAEEEIPWVNIRGFRNVLVHEYFRVDLDIAWNIVENELPMLVEALHRMIRRLGEQTHTGQK